MIEKFFIFIFILTFLAIHTCTLCKNNNTISKVARAIHALFERVNLGCAPNRLASEFYFALDRNRPLHQKPAPFCGVCVLSPPLHVQKLCKPSDRLSPLLRGLDFNYGWSSFQLFSVLCVLFLVSSCSSAGVDCWSIELSSAFYPRMFILF